MRRRWWRGPKLDATERRALVVALILFATSLVLGTQAWPGLPGTLAAFTARATNAGTTFQLAGRFAPYDVTGLAIAGPQIQLTWTAVSDLAWATSYNVYRGATSGSYPTRIFSSVAPCSPVPCALSVTTTPPDSAIYYYIVRGVDALGQEGLNSNETANAVDLTAPVVNAVVPYDGQLGVAISPTIQIFFSKAMSPSTSTSAISLVPCNDNTPACTSPGSAVAITVTWISGNTTATFQPVGLANNRFYQIRVSTAAKDPAGNALATARTTAFQTIAAGAPPATPPNVVLPTNPANQTTSVATNRQIAISFDQTMDQASTQGAVSIQACTSGPATGAATICQALGSTVSISGYTWGGAAYNDLTVTPASLATSTWYQVTISTAAKNPSNQALTSQVTFVFQTSTAADTTAPDAPHVTSPAMTAYVTMATYTIAGSVTNGDGVTAELNPLIRIYRDGNGNGTYDPTNDPLVATEQLAGGMSSFGIDVALSSGSLNQFFVTAQDNAGNVSAAATVPVIDQGDTRTDPHAIVAVGGSDVAGGTINVLAQFLADSNGNGSATAAVCSGTNCTNFGTATALTRSPASGAGPGQYGALLTGLSNLVTYTVKVVFTDPNGFVSVSNCNAGSTATTCSQTTVVQTAAGGTQQNLIDAPTSVPMIASRAQTLTLAVTGAGRAFQMKVVFPNGTNLTLNAVSTSGSDPTCDKTSPYTFTWDGKDASGNYVPDGTYTYSILAYTGLNCINAANQIDGNAVEVMNAASVTLSPLPGAATLGAGQKVAIVATALDTHNMPLGDGATVSFTATGYVSSANFSLSRTTALTGQSYADCAALYQNVTSGSGKACTVLTVNAAVLQAITVRASVASQIPGTTTSQIITATTTINDPPAEPSPISAAVDDRASPAPRDPRPAGAAWSPTADVSAPARRRRPARRVA